MNLPYYLLSFTLLFLLELAYFRTAKYFSIVDLPNNRSSHKESTIRGGGIIFILSMVINAGVDHLQYPAFITGLVLISTISFIDDVKTVSNKLRLVFHLVAASLLLYQLGAASLSGYIILILLIIVIGVINAVNFMDGINGMTGVYSLATLVTLLFMNNYILEGFTSTNLLVTASISVLVFLFFNFRQKARCFAGDVGSVGIAFIIIFILGQLISYSGNWRYVLILLVYGLDSVTTILFRLIRGENIFKAHRTHFYQFLSNQRGISQRKVSLSYAMAQLTVNFVVIFSFGFPTYLLISFVILVSFIFLFLRIYLEGELILSNKAKRS